MESAGCTESRSAFQSSRHVRNQLLELGNRIFDGALLLFEPHHLAFRFSEHELQLFDMQADPLELTNVAEDNPAVVERLMQALEAFRADTRESAAVDVGMDQKLLDALEALGYAGDDEDDEE